MATRLTSEQRKIVAEKIIDFGNLGGAAMIVGQFVAPEQFNALVLLFGISFLITTYLVGILIMRGGEFS